MIKIARTLDEHWEMIRDITIPGCDLFIATFGVGISHEAQKSMNMASKVCILIGTPEGGLTPGHQGSLNVYATKLKNTECQFRSNKKSHMKCWIARSKGKVWAVVGGRNLCNSTFHDMSVLLERRPARLVLKHFNEAWRQSKPADNYRNQLMQELAQEEWPDEY